MKISKQRRQLAWEAARLMGQQSDLTYAAASELALLHLFPAGVSDRHLPSNEEISEQLRLQAESISRPAWENRFAHYARLLVPLSTVGQDPHEHPEGDALYHSLQVFQLVAAEFDYDEELMTAALLHDVGKAIDRRNPVDAAVAALSDLITERTVWFIVQLPQAKAYLKNALGQRARRRLELEHDFEQLLCLARADLEGRKRGVVVPDIEAALEQICTLHDEAEH